MSLESNFWDWDHKDFLPIPRNFAVRMQRLKMRSRAVMTASSQFFRTPMRTPERPAAVVSEGVIYKVHEIGEGNHFGYFSVNN